MPTRLHPDHTPWSPARIADQTGRTAVVTGANNGIGFVTALELSRRGALVVLACRDLERGRAAADRIRHEAVGADVRVCRLDLGSLTSVRAFADGWDLGPLDLLVNNAGIALVPPGWTADGFESQFGVNHLGHFALTGLLLPSLLAAPNPRVVTVTSESQRWGRIDFSNLNAERRYRRLTAYVQSKHANVYFAAHLQRQASAAGHSLRSMAAVPGFTATNVLTGGAHRGSGRSWQTLAAIANRFAKPIAEGALSSLYAATEPDLPGGSYVAPSGPLELRGEPTPRDARRAARDDVTARRLWALSEELTGVRYTY